MLGSVLIMKCCMNGLFWPTIPFQIKRDIDGFMTVGEGVERSIMSFVNGNPSDR